nr:sporulation protein YabP [bacterium]
MTPLRELEPGDKHPTPIIGRTHTIMVENREHIIVTGVQDVESFNEAEVTLVTEGGVLTLIGQGMHIVKLSLEEGQLVLDGLMEAMEYAQQRQEGRRGLFSRMMR